jgi:hypothetical protein
VDLQKWIDDHISLKRPVFSIKAVNCTGSATLPKGKHLRCVKCQIENLTIEGDKSTLVIQDSQINGTLTINSAAVP